jgi:hypothetical protein
MRLFGKLSNITYNKAKQPQKKILSFLVFQNESLSHPGN